MGPQLWLDVEESHVKQIGVSEVDLRMGKFHIQVLSSFTNNLLLLRIYLLWSPPVGSLQQNYLGSLIK